MSSLCGGRVGSAPAARCWRACARTGSEASLNELASGYKAVVGAAITVLVVYITGTNSLPIEQFHRSLRAALPSWHSLDAFASWTLVDDGALDSTLDGVL